MTIYKSKYHHYNPKLKLLARALRKNMTKAEACLWKYALKGGRMRGYTFNRQRPVSNYIVDFMCKPLKLVIEVDGITHQLLYVQSKDRLKEHKLKILGFAVLRFSDEEVLTNIDKVYDQICKWIDDNPPPAPPSAGDKDS